MKVYLIMDGDITRMIVVNKTLADKIVQAFDYLGLKSVEMEVIGEYHATC